MFDDLVAAILAIPRVNQRRVIAIVGAPASGKSTLAAGLAQTLPHASVLPMDGFHHDNAYLKRQGSLARKGAPHTFDVAGLKQVLTQVQNPDGTSFPTFDRAGDRTVPNTGHIKATDQTVIVEGNYLLLDTEPWSDLASFWDFSVFLDTPLEVLEARLIARWLHFGHTLGQAKKRAEDNDLINARLVADCAERADMCWKGDLSTH